MKKYELTSEYLEFQGKKLFRIRALRDFADVKVNQLGGFIEKEENLSHDGDSWVYDYALVYDDAVVYDDARIFDNAKVYNFAKVRGNVKVFGNAEIFDNANVYHDAVVYGNSKVFGCARVYGNSYVFGNSWVFDGAAICDNARVCGSAWVCGNAYICGNAVVSIDALISKESHTLQVGMIGSRNGLTTFYRTKDLNIFVKQGFFIGSIFDFMAEVIKTHENSKHIKVYLLAIKMAIAQIDDVKIPTLRG